MLLSSELQPLLVAVPAWCHLPPPHRCGHAASGKPRLLSARCPLPARSPCPRSETYQYFNLPFCHPKEGKEYKPEGLGEVLEGDRLVSTPYKIK